MPLEEQLGHADAAADLIANGLAQLLREPEKWQRLVSGEYDIPVAVEEPSHIPHLIFRALTGLMATDA